MYFNTADHWIIFLPIRCISARTGTKINQGDLCSTGSVAPWYTFDWIHSRNKQWLTSVETETLWASLSMSQHINSATGKKWVKQLFLVSWTSLYWNSIHSWLDQNYVSGVITPSWRFPISFNKNCQSKSYRPKQFSLKFKQLSWQANIWAALKNLEKQSPAIEIEEIKISLVIGQLVFRNKENRVINR